MYCLCQYHTDQCSKDRKNCLNKSLLSTHKENILDVMETESISLGENNFITYINKKYIDENGHCSLNIEFYKNFLRSLLKFDLGLQMLEVKEHLKENGFLNARYTDFRNNVVIKFYREGHKYIFVVKSGNIKSLRVLDGDTKLWIASEEYLDRI